MKIERKFRITLPDKIEYSLLKNDKFTVHTENYEKWREFFNELEKASKMKLVLAKTVPKPTSKKLLNANLMCHHGFRKDANTYIATNLSGKKKKNECKFEIVAIIEKNCPKTMIVEIKGYHNHDLESIHSQSFLKPAKETVNSIENLFAEKKLPAEAQEIIEKNLTADQLCNRSLAPHPEDYYRFYYKWLIENFGSENGPEMFDALEEKMSKYSGKVFYNSNIKIASNKQLL